MEDLSDSEEPPSLVDTSHNDPDTLSSPAQKVPITIITGKKPLPPQNLPV